MGNFPGPHLTEKSRSAFICLRRIARGRCVALFFALCFRNMLVSGLRQVVEPHCDSIYQFRTGRCWAHPQGSPGLKKNSQRQATSALHRLAEPPHPRPPTRMNKLYKHERMCTLCSDGVANMYANVKNTFATYTHSYVDT